MEMEQEEQYIEQWMEGDTRSAFIDNDRLGLNRNSQY